MVIEVSFEHPLKTLSPIVVSDKGSVTDDKLDIW